MNLFLFTKEAYLRLILGEKFNFFILENYKPLETQSLISKYYIYRTLTITYFYVKNIAINTIYVDREICAYNLNYNMGFKLGNIFYIQNFWEIHFQI